LGWYKQERISALNAISNELKWPSLILVNGPSSAGKTTLCRALQAAIERPYLVVGFDDFIFMSATRYYRGADTTEQSQTDAWTALGAEMVRTSPPGAPVSMMARFGPVFRHLLDAMAPAVRTLIDRGNPVIFDHVLHDRSMYESYLAASAGLDVFTVGVTCPLDVLEMRERARGDRVLGRARGLSEVVHTFCAYDTMIDTGTMTPEACVKTVLGALIDSRQAP
jgi:chloramphenicol 3-O phosphotransferase